MSFYLYGGGGHAKVAIDILHKLGKLPVAIVVDTLVEGSNSIYGIPIMHSSQVLATDGRSDSSWLVAIGNNKIRKAVTRKLLQHGGRFETAIHPSAQIALGVTIAPGTIVMANAVINSDCEIGQHVIINTGATVDHDCRVDDYAHVAPGCSLCGGVKINEGALLGVGTKVKPQTTVGSWATCGAGSVVISPIPSHAIAYGCPAVIH